VPGTVPASAARLGTLDGEPRLTGPPFVASLDGSNIYLSTRRLRI
jgi:hypothetical protein